VLVDPIGQGHELFLAQLAVAVLVEPGEQFFGLRHIRRSIVTAVGAVMTIRAMAIAITAIFFMARPLITVAIVTSLTMASFHELPHLLAGFLSFVVTQLAVAVFVELLDDFFANLGAGGPVVAWLRVTIVGICSHGGDGQQPGRSENKTT
jgi:hypothetical protein